jgi:hypothetical protein
MRRKRVGKIRKRKMIIKRRTRSLLATCFHAGIFLGLFFDPEDGGDMFLRNVGLLSTDYTALYPRK